MKAKRDQVAEPPRTTRPRVPITAWLSSNVAVMVVAFLDRFMKPP